MAALHGTIIRIYNSQGIFLLDEIVSGPGFRTRPTDAAV